MEDRSVTLPDGSQYRICRRSSCSRPSWPLSRAEASEEASEEEEYKSSSGSDEDTTHPSSPGSEHPPVPSPARTRSSLESEDTSERNTGIGQMLGRVLGKAVREKWFVRKPPAPASVPLSPALQVPRPLFPPENLTPPPPARPEGRAETSSTSSGSQRDRALSSRTSREQAAPPTSPALGRRSRHPPDRYQARLPPPATTTRKDGKVRREKRT